MEPTSSAPSSAAAPRQRALWQSVFIPGLAVPVFAELVATRGRDALQRAVLGLLAAGPMTAEGLAADLGIQETPLVETVLGSLVDAAAVEPDGGLYRLAPHSGAPDLSRSERGWMFWDSLQQQFLPRLFIDPHHRRAADLFRPEGAGLIESLDDSGPRDPAVLWRAVQRGDFTIQRVEQRGPAREFHEEADYVLRAISFAQGPRERFPLAVLAETRVRIAGEPALFLYEPQVTVDELAAPVFSPMMAGLLEHKLPQIFARAWERARRENDAFLRQNHAELLTKLGGAEKLAAESEAIVRERLRGVTLRPEFDTPGLHQVAVQAENTRAFLRHKLRDEPAARRDFAAVLQALADVLGETMAAVLRQPELERSIDHLAVDLKHLPSEAERRRECRARIDAACRDLGLHYRGFDLSGHLSAPAKLRSALASPAQRSQLRAAISLWLIPPILDSTSPVGASHLAWVRTALRECPDLLDIYYSTAEQRHLDKASRRPAGDEMPFEAFATNTYRIWRAIGATESST